MRVLTELFFWILLKTGAFSAFFASLPEKIAQNKGFWASSGPFLGPRALNLFWASGPLFSLF